jgi:hypothetical protein
MADAIAEALSTSADGLTERQLADALGNTFTPKAVRAVLVADPIRFRKLPGRTLKFWRLKWKAIRPSDQAPAMSTPTNELDGNRKPPAAPPSDVAGLTPSPELIDDETEQQVPSADEVRPADEVDRYRSELGKPGVGTRIAGPSPLRPVIHPGHPILAVSDNTLDVLAGAVEPYIDTD